MGLGGSPWRVPFQIISHTYNEKNRTYSVSYVIMTRSGTYDVIMTIFPSGRADATIGSSWPGKLNYLGIPCPTRRI